MSNRWSKVEAFLDKEVQRETKRIIAKAKAAMGLGGTKNSTNGTNGHPKPVETKVRRKSSAKVKGARVLHGRYLGLTRGLSEQQKRDVKDIRSRKGVMAAIKAAKVYIKRTAAEA